MILQHRTRGNAPVKGKQHIFLHADAGDSALRDRLADLILSTKDGDRYAVFYADGPISFDLDFGSADLSPMVLYVPLITAGFMAECPGSFSFDSIRLKGVSILPVVDDASRMPDFNRRFENAHAISLSMKDPGYEIGIQLDRLLISPALYDEIIKDAFTRMLFISYRKKDREQIIRIMKAVRNTKWAAAAAFWFDDYLVPGTDFADGITQAMADSDAVIMAVTPNLPALTDEGRKNYVCSEEYPRARNTGRKIIAIEALPTERKQLDDMFGEDFPECIPIDDSERIGEALESVGRAGEESRDPYVLYLRAMGFLNGIRVEKDPARAIRLLDECAGLGVPEAAYQLAYMYTFGIVVPTDLKAAVEYMNRAFEIAEGMEDPEEKLEWMYRILSNGGKDRAIEPGTTPGEKDRYYEAMIRAIEQFEQDYPDRAAAHKDKYLLWKAEMHASLGNVEDGIHTAGSEEYDQLMEAQRLLDQVSNRWNSEFYRVSAVVNSLLSSWCRAAERHSEALKYARAAADWQEKVAQSDPSFETRWQLVTYRSNVVGCELFALDNTPGMKEQWKRELSKCIEMYEALYAEKKTPVLAGELAGCYENMMITARNTAEAEQFVTRALERAEELSCDWPDADVKEKENRIRQDLYRIRSAMTGSKLAATVLHYLLILVLVLTAVPLFNPGGQSSPSDGFVKVFLAIAMLPAVLKADARKTRRHLWITLLVSLVVLGAILIALTLTNTSMADLMAPIPRGILLMVLALISLIA